jgi:hypothetical protein
MWQCCFPLERVTYMGGGCSGFEVRRGIKFSVLLFLEFRKRKESIPSANDKRSYRLLVRQSNSWKFFIPTLTR